MNSQLPPIMFPLVVIPLLAAGVMIVWLVMTHEAHPPQFVAVLGLSYLLGSVPWGYMLLAWRRGLDIREYGSGRTGMSNVLRTAGGKTAGLVFALDLGKGLVAVLLAREVIGTTSGEVAAGLCALVGHNWPVFLQFRGGRGILTGFGGLWVMAPWVAAIGTVAFIFITLISRYVSLGSVLGLIITCIAMLALSLVGLYSSTYTLYVFLGSAIIIWQHRDNIRRIRQGNERRLGNPATKLN